MSQGRCFGGSGNYMQDSGPCTERKSGWKDSGGSLGHDHMTDYRRTLWIRRQ